MDFFRPLDHGTTYFFDYLATTRRDLYPVFAGGCWASSWLVAALVALATACLLARRGDLRQSVVVLGAFVFAHVMVEVVRMVVGREPPNFGLKWLDEGAARSELYLSSSFPSPSILLSTQAWLFLVLTVRAISGRKRIWLPVALAAAVVVLGGFVCNLALGRHYLSDLLASLCGGAGVALVSWGPCCEKASADQTL